MNIRRCRLALCSSLALVALLWGCGQGPVITADKSPRPVKAMVLTQAQSSETVSLPAILEPVDQAQLAFRVAGPVQNVLVQEGQRVAKGEVLMHLDPHDFEVQITEYQARLLEAEAQARQARQEQARVAAAGRDDAIARVELDRANTAVERTEAAVTIVEQRLQMMQDALSYSVLRAPFDGVVSNIEIDTHEQAVPALSVVTVHGDGGLQARVDLPEQLANRVHLGMAGALLLSNSDSTIPTEVTEISRSASVLSRTFRMTARLNRQPDNAWPEQTGLMQLSLASPDGAGFLIPTSALQSSGGQHYVALVNDGRIERVSVSVVGYDRDQVRVQGTLAPGNVLVVAGAPYFNDGDEVGDVLLGNQEAEL
ncbi:efflux RND transporter periplasmic adaptor subunit [Ferrimonas balearica]|uniref:efflux RND transporter periplasmic adaptor subunit n=1 Tax=Ferrimonas balearica TaxID=44012 RepID=UPI001C994FB4|nr:efflux RND transporter periplasmic adaptor subunit [Ferrimonas balearica]MBY5991797.1 efflux RND transporter periplasmic adaptor subunit [Ferrimonas balearica]